MAQNIPARPLPPGVEILPPENSTQSHADGGVAPQFPWLQLVIMFAIMVLYTGSPLDLVPDFIPILGQMDDLAVGGGTLALIMRSLFKYYARQLAFKAGVKPAPKRGFFSRLFSRSK